MSRRLKCRFLTVRPGPFGLLSLLPALLLPLFLLSCADSLGGSLPAEKASGEEYEVSPSPDGKTYLQLAAPRLSDGRSISPSAADYNVSQLTNLVLEGCLEGEDDMHVLASGESYSAIGTKLIPVSEAGMWNFILSARLGGVPFTARSSGLLALGTTSTIPFTLKADENYGGLAVTLTFTGTSLSAGDYKVEAFLMNEQNAEILENVSFTGSSILPVSQESDNKSFSVTYSRSASDESSRLEAGTYFLGFAVYRLYADEGTTEERQDSLNTSRNVVRIDPGITTTADISLTLNDVYTITYDADGGSLASGEVQCFNYSRKSEDIRLPLLTKEGHIFGGWYGSEDFAENSRLLLSEDGVHQVVQAGSTGDLSLYARFYEPALYVSASGSSDNTGFTADSSLPDFDSALEKIRETADSSLDWTIFIDGTIVGAQMLPANLDGKASSLRLTGKTGSESDILSCEGLSDTVVLTVTTAVPLSIENLTITKGTTGLQVTDESGVDSDGADVTLGEGCLIKGNSTASGVNVVKGRVELDGGSIIGNSSASGGGVYISGGEFIMKRGVISGNTAEDDGSGVYVSAAATFKMGGAAAISDDNDVYLAAGDQPEESAKITIVEAFDGDIAQAARITPASYSSGLVLLAADGADLSLEYGGFTVTPQVSGDTTSKWRINSQGQLQPLLGGKSAPDAVNDIVFNDGSALAYTDGLTLTDAQKAAAIAIIFYVGSDLNNGDDTDAVRTLGVGLKGTKLAWAVEGAAGALVNITTIQSDVKDGSRNFELMGQFLAENGSTDDTGDETMYPAFAYAKNYKATAGNIEGTDFEDGWYLPSLAEMTEYQRNNSWAVGSVDAMEIGKAATAVGYSSIFENDWHWTSSQHETLAASACSTNTDTTYNKNDELWMIVIREF